MDVFASIFDRHCKCSSCNKPFKLSSKRRKCVICSIFNLELLYCKRCSVKESHPHYGFLAPKRYCLSCFNDQPARKTKNSNSPSPVRNPTEPTLRRKETVEEKEQRLPEGWQRMVTAAGIDNQELENNKESIVGIMSFMLEGVKKMPSRLSVISM